MQYTRLNYILYCLLSVVLNNYVIKQIAVKSIHKLILFIEQNKDRKICDAISSNSHVKNGSELTGRGNEI